MGALLSNSVETIKFRHYCLQTWMAPSLYRDVYPDTILMQERIWKN